MIRSTFNSVYLTGDDAKAFESQIQNQSPPPAAIEACRKGRILASELATKGYVPIPLNPSKEQ